METPYSVKRTGSPFLTVPELYKIYSIIWTLAIVAATCCHYEGTWMLETRCALSCLILCLSFSPPLFVVSFADSFENTIVPYQQPPKPLRTQWFHINYHVEKHGCETAKKCMCIFKFFTMRVLLFNKYGCIYCTTYKYIHTDIASVQHINVSLYVCICMLYSNDSN